MGRPKLYPTEREKKSKYTSRLSGDMKAKWNWLALLQKDTPFPLADALIESLEISFKRERRNAGLPTTLSDKEVSELLSMRFRN